MAAVEFAFKRTPGARGDELRATGARLQVTVGGEIVTRLIDRRSRGERAAVYLPLYPLAEWLATHWWLLRHEPEVPERAAFATYESRHNVRTAGEGFALPDLSVRPTGAALYLVWHRRMLPAQQVAFTAEGTASVDAAHFRDQAGRFIDAVLRRLGERDVSGTLLQRECAVNSRPRPRASAAGDPAARQPAPPDVGRARARAPRGRSRVAHARRDCAGCRPAAAPSVRRAHSSAVITSASHTGLMPNGRPSGPTACPEKPAIACLLAA